MTLASDARAIARAGIRAVDPGGAVRAAVRRRGTSVLLGGAPWRGANPESVRIVALGKASAAMAEAAARALGSRAGGIVVLPHRGRVPRGPFEVIRAGHPVPDAGSFAAARRVRALLQEETGHPVLFLISGGGSALFEYPPEGIEEADLRATARLLLRCGAPIQAMNVLRRHVSAVKGGRLGALAAGRPVATLAISDVVGDTPWDIASGPTVPDPTTFREARAAAERFAIWSRLPPRVRAHLERGVRRRAMETPKPGDPRLKGQPFHLVATNARAIAGASAEAARRGYRVLELSSAFTGETRELARVHAALLRGVATEGHPLRPPACLLSGGESTVRLGAHPGRGGRNQEFALALVQDLAGTTGLLGLSVGTDGVDGPTDAAGGWADSASAVRARRRGVDLERALLRHESYDTLRRLGTLWRTGPTGTNVMDLHVLLAARGARA